MIDAVLDVQGFLAKIRLLASRRSFSNLFQSRLLLHLGLGTVLGQELENIGGQVLVSDTRELIDRGRHLQAVLQNHLLTLKADVFGPFHKSAQVTLGLDIVANAKVTGTLLNQRVAGGFGGFAFGERRRSDFLDFRLNTRKSIKDGWMDAPFVFVVGERGYGTVTRTFTLTDLNRRSLLWNKGVLLLVLG